MKSASSLVVESLSFRYGTGPTDPQVFNNINFSIAPNQIAALVGASGIGKSTLLRVLAGQLPKSGGEVRLPIAERDYASVVYHAQKAMLLPWVSVDANLMLGARFARRQETVNPGKLRSQLGLEKLGGRYPAFLSGGEVERVALGRTLLTPSRVYLFDEPLSGTDYIKRVDIECRLVEFLRKDRIAVFVTHDLPQALAVSDFVLVLARGDGGTQLQRIDLPPEFQKLSPAERRESEYIGPLVRELTQSVGRP